MNVEDQPPRAGAAAHEPPDGGYGWVCVFAQFLVNGFTWGVAASYSVYLAHYLSHDLFPGARSLDYALIGGLNFAVALLASPLATGLVRRHGVRAPMAGGAALLAAGLLAASFASAAASWFATRRSLANGLATAGSGLGGLAICLATSALLDAVGRPWTLRATAAVVPAVNLVATLLMRSRHRDVQSDLRVFTLQPLASYQARLLLALSVVVMFGYITLMFSLSDYAITIGRSSKESATVAALLNLGAAIGRPILGHVSDHLGRVQVACVLTFGCGILIFTIWLPSTSYATLLVFTITGGAITGIFWTVIAPLAAEVVGLQELPAFLNIIWLSVALPSLFAEVIALQLRQPLLGARSYVYTQIFAGVSYTGSGMIMMELWRVRGKESISPPTSQHS